MTKWDLLREIDPLCPPHFPMVELVLRYPQLPEQLLYPRVGLGYVRTSGSWWLWSLGASVYS